MRAGDTVKHLTSGETWTVAATLLDGSFYAEGWPCTLAQQSDAVVLEAATDAEHIATLRTWASYKDGDPRSSAARREIERAHTMEA